MGSLPTTAPHQGCTVLSLPFTATSKGSVARVLIHIAPVVVNELFTLLDTGLTTTKPGVEVRVAASTFTSLGGVVVVVDIRRTDASPTTAISGSIVFPGNLFTCTPDNTKQPRSHGGLPWAVITLEAPSTPLGVGEQTAIAVGAMVAADLQTVAAIGMLRCTPGSDEDVESEAGIRALVPVALSGTCAGAVQGALLAIGVAGILSGVAICAVKAVKKDVGWMEAAARARCPGIVIAVWAFVQMGLVVCGARLATADGGGADVVLGVVGVVVGAILPAVCVCLARGVVSRRCYRLAQVPDAVAGRHKMVVWARSVFLPSYELDTDVYPVSKAFSTVVGRTRRPSCLWAGLPAMQPVVMLLVVFVRGELCSVFLIVAGVAMLLMGALCHVLFRPHRIVAANYLQGFAMALNAAMLFIASKLVGDPLDTGALGANAAIAMIQVGLSVCRFAHNMCYLGYMRLYEKTTLTVCGADGKLPPSTATTTTTSSLTQPAPVFDIQCALCVKPHVTEEADLSPPPAIVVGVTEDAIADMVPVARSAPSIINVDDVDVDGGPPLGGGKASEGSPPPIATHKTPPPPPPPSSTAAEETPKHLSITPTPLPAASSIIKKRSKPTPTVSLRSKAKKKTNVFDWNPKCVPMERPYSMLYEEDFLPSDEQDGDDMNLQMDSLLPSSELGDDVDDGVDSIKSQEIDNSIL